MIGFKELHDVPIPMRDGLTLAANIFLPDMPGKFPAIMAFTGFGKDNFWSGTFQRGWQVSYEENTPTLTGSCTFEANDPRFWCPYGYAIVIVDPRGLNGSPGTLAKAEVDGPPGEVAILYEGRWARDQYDAIEWIGTRDWCNGNVGLSGVSILAFSQWRVAGLNPPHLKAVNPWEGMTDFYRDNMFPGGIPETKFSAGMKEVVFPNTSQWEAPENEVPPEPIYKEEDEFLSDITLPILIGANWTDHGAHTRGSFRAWKKVSSKYKWLHLHGHLKWATFYTSESRTLRKLFFDCFLKGIDDRILSIPPVRMEVFEDMNRYSIRWEDSYPPKSCCTETMYLDASDGKIKPELPSDEASCGYDSLCGHVNFDFKFDKDTEFIGHSALNLWVSTDAGDDMDLFVTLRKLDKNGNEVHFDGVLTPKYQTVALGWLRVSKRKLDMEKSTATEPYQVSVFDDGEKIKPGEIVPCSVSVLPAGILFRKGETLRIEISGLYRGGEEIPDPERDYKTHINCGKHSIYTGGKYPSSFVASYSEPHNSQVH